MNTENALIYGYLLDGRGGGNALDWDAIDAWTPGQGLLWVHLDSTVAESSSWLMKKSGIDSLICESLLEQESRPRNVLTNDGLLLILRGVNSNPKSEPEDMVAVRMLISEQRIISMRYRKIMAMQDIHQNIETGKGPRSAGEFLVMVAELIADRMGNIISEIDDNVDELEDAVLTAESHDLRTQLSGLRRATIGLRRYIAPQRDVLARLLHERIGWFSDTDRAHLREVAERTARFVEDVDAARERAAVTQEELNNRLSEQMNKAMYVLSIVAAIFLPLGLLTGLLGINVGGIPGTESPWAFSLVTIFLIIIAVGLVTLFRRIKWL